MALLSAGLVLGVSSIASASLLPGGNPFSILDGGGQGTFYDFGSVFSDSSGLFEGGFGGMLGEIEGLLAGSEGLSASCGMVIMNFAPSAGDTDCSGGGIFDDIFSAVGGEIGLPDEAIDVILGNKRPKDIFQDVLDEALAEIGLSNILDKAGGSVGQQGIPEPDEILADLFRSSHQRTFGNITTLDGPLPISEAGSAQIGRNLFTPSVNTTLGQDVVALHLLTTAVTDKGLSKEGQEVTEARHAAAQISSKASGTIGTTSTEMAAKQLEAAAGMSSTVKAQTSTQDTLKEALTGMNMLQAQSTQLEAQANTQRALSTQLDGVALQTTQEMRDGVFANGISLQTLNEQVSEESQKSLAQAASLRQEHERNIRMFGAMR